MSDDFKGSTAQLDALLEERGARLFARQVVQRAELDAIVPAETAAQRVRRRLAQEAEHAQAPRLRRIR